MNLSGIVAAIAPETGQELWRTTAADVCILEHDGRVFAGCNGHLFCLDGCDGKKLWQSSLKGMGHNGRSERPQATGGCVKTHSVVG